MEKYLILFSGLVKRYSYPAESEIKIGRLITTIPTLYETWRVKFGVYLTTSYGNILHMTTAKESFGMYGERNPYVYFQPDGTLFIASSISGNLNHKFVSKKVQKKNWIKIEISQQVVDGNYSYSIQLDDKVVHAVINNQPQVFHDMKVYVSNPWNRAKSGRIRNLVIVTKAGKR